MRSFADDQSNENPRDFSRSEMFKQYKILDTSLERDFDSVALLAAQLCNTPIALISLIAAGRQWFIAKIGLDISESPLSQSICAQALSRPGLLVISDLTQEAQTRHNPLVAGPPDLRFYAGIRLEARGDVLGTLCVVDTRPRRGGLTQAEAQGLEALSYQRRRSLTPEIPKALWL